MKKQILKLGDSYVSNKKVGPFGFLVTSPNLADAVIFTEEEVNIILNTSCMNPIPIEV
jgi:hypothetical protein